MIQGSAPPDSPEVLALIRGGMPLVEPIVRGVCVHLAKHARVDDFLSFGHEGLILAARSFEKRRGVPFERWATLKIRGAICEGIRRPSDFPRAFHAKLRAIAAANDTDEGLLEEDASPPPSTPELADERLTSHLTAMATSMALGMLLTRDDAALESLEAPGGTVEDEAIREELAARVRQAIAERPPQERAMLEAYYFEGKSLEKASGGLSRAWARRLLARATNGVARSLKSADLGL